LIAEYPEYSSEIFAYYNQWEIMLNGAIEDTVKILKSIRDQYSQVYALTNWSAETFPIAQRHYPFLDWFDGILVSGEEKLKKPDPKIYQLLLKRFNLDPSSCLFIDDNIRNVKAAEKEGISSIHYKNSGQLIEQLKSQDIKF
jgi:2-haloacid dehalogenase